MKKVLSFALAFCVLLTAFSGLTVFADEAVQTEDGITYSYDEETRTLTILGNGEMDNYAWWNDIYPPWYGYQKQAEKVIIDEGITSIGDYAFDEFSVLKEVEIAKSVTRIGMHSFSNTALQSIDIHENVSDIRYMAFVNCTSMSSYNVAEENPNYCSRDGALFTKDMSVLKVYPLAKEEEEGVYTVPDEVEEIEGYAFSQADRLSKVVFGQNLKSIGDECFFESDLLEEIVFNEGLEFIGGGAFQHCYLIESFDLPSTLTKIRPLAFYDTAFYNNRDNWENDLLYIGEYLITGEYCILSDSWEIEDEEYYAEGHIDIKEGTVLIASSAFSWFTWDSPVTSVSFPVSLKYINEYAFSYCDKISSIKLFSFVEWIDEGAFSGCSLLANVSLGSNIKSIGMNAFKDTPFIKNENYYFDGVLYRDGYLLAHNGNLPDTITIQDGTVLIADCALAGGGTYSYHDFTVEIPSSLKYIGKEAFEGTRMTKIVIPETVLTIGDYAIGYKKTYNNVIEEYEYSLISNMTIEGYADTAGETYADAFDISFKDLNAPEEIVFGCYTAIVEGETLTITSFDWDPSYSSVVDIPVAHYGMTVTKIAAGAFDDCSVLTQISIPPYITTIEDGAFVNYDNVQFVVDCGSPAEAYLGGKTDKVTVVHDFPDYTDGVVDVCPGCAKTRCELEGHIDNGAGECLRDGCEYSFDGPDIGGGDSGDQGGSGGEQGGSGGEQGGETEETFTEGLFTYVIRDAEAVIIAVDPTISGTVEIPSDLGWFTVTAIEEQAFTSCNKLEEVIIPDTVKTIGMDAFSNCRKLRTVKIGNGVTTIGEYAFSNDSGLKTLILGCNVTFVGQYAFMNCVQLADVWYANGMSDRGNTITTDIGNNIFNNATWHYYTCSYQHWYSGDCDAQCDSCDWTRSTSGDHRYTNDCDAECNVCYAIRETEGHRYSNDCDAYCNRCGSYREVFAHDYDNDCDAQCNQCGETRYVSHSYSDASCATPAKCKICGATSGSKLGHTYTNNCDKSCNRCGATRTVSHNYAAATCKVAKKCTICGVTSGSALGHTYSNACDKACKRCGTTRTTKHSYTNSCDTSCNVCKATRSVSHSYKTTTTKATLTKNGSIVKKCTVCSKVASNTAIKYAKTFKLSATSYTYDGKVKTPTVSVKDSAGKTLVKDKDYTVTYASGRKNVGTYKVTVKMKGNYTGTKTLTFKINPVKIAKCSVKLSATDYAYNGSTKTPTVTVKNASGKSLKKGTDYTVTYASGRKNVGTYKVTVKMKGNYTGTKTLTFKINPKAASINKLTAGTKSLIVKLNRSLKQSTGYQIQYSTSKTFASYKTKKLTDYEISSTNLTGLKAKTTYYVRVRTYKTVNGKTYYSNWSTAKSMKTK